MGEEDSLRRPFVARPPTNGLHFRRSPLHHPFQRQNKDALISRVPTAHSHGLTIVNYANEKGVKDKKENAMIPRGKSRNSYGGFYSS